MTILQSLSGAWSARGRALRVNFMSFSKALLLLCCVMAASGLAAQSRIHYVRPGAGGAGTSWADARGDLAATLRAAAAGDEVWVARGRYVPVQCNPCRLQDRQVSFELRPGVRLRGGFSGTERSLAERPPFAPEQTVLSGRIAPGVDSLDSETVVLALASTPGTLLEGFTVAQGRAETTSGARGDRTVAGALLFAAAAGAGDTLSLEIRDCYFRDGRSSGLGGAVFIASNNGRHSAAFFERCSFRQNTAGSGGGAVAITTSPNGSDASAFSFCRFRENSATLEGGGALYWNGGQGGRVFGSLDSCSFVGNDAGTGSGGAVRAYGTGGMCSPVLTQVDFRQNRGRFGGAIEIDGSFGGQAAPRISDASFTNNESVLAGGAVHVDAIVGGNCEPIFARCVFTDNLANESGGAIFFNAIQGRCLPTVRDCRIERNRSVLYGGGIYAIGRLGRCDPVVINTLFARNRGYSAGGFYCLGSESGQCNPLIVNCAFVNNKAVVGGALYANANDTTGSARPQVFNTIFQGNQAGTGPTLRNIFGEPSFSHCSFDRPSCESLRSGTGPQHRCLDGNLFGVPDVFRDTLGQDYRLRDDARVLDMGLDSVLLQLGVLRDLWAAPRFRGLADDLGPIEYSGDAISGSVALSAHQVTLCAGDILEVVAQVNTIYAGVQGYWSFGASRLPEGDTLRIDNVTSAAAGSYTYSIDLGGELLRDTLLVVVTTPEPTELSLTGAGMPARLLVGQTYSLTVDVAPEQLLDSLVWLNEAGAVVARGRTYAFGRSVAGTYGLHVKAYFRSQCLAARVRTLDLTLIVETSSKVLENSLEAPMLRVLGNPVKDRLAVRHSWNGPFSYRIVDVLGRDVAVGTVSALAATIEVTSLTQGTYLVLFTNGQIRYRASFVKL